MSLRKQILLTVGTALAIALSATERAATIVLALKTYAHPNSSGKPQLIDLAESINTVLTLHQNQLKRGIEVVSQRFPPAPYPVLSQRNQPNLD